jgi:hypothetical protein
MAQLLRTLVTSVLQATTWREAVDERGSGFDSRTDGQAEERRVHQDPQVFYGMSGSYGL